MTLGPGRIKVAAKPLYCSIVLGLTHRLYTNKLGQTGKISVTGTDERALEGFLPIAGR